MKQSIEIKPDQKNDLYFNVNIEGTEVPQEISIRLVCEGESFDYCFRGTPVGKGEVKVTIPPLPKNLMQEGKEYLSSLEVTIDNKTFRPIQFNLKLPNQPKVTAEILQKTEQPLVESQVTAEINSKTEIPTATVQTTSSLREKHSLLASGRKPLMAKVIETEEPAEDSVTEVKARATIKRLLTK